MQVHAQIPQVSSGSIIHYVSLGVGHPRSRTVDIWLPPDYDSSRRYAVLYMQDGQMLFDAGMTWNHQSWQVAETISRLVAQKKIPPVIVVGVWNSGLGRHADYFPQQPSHDMTAEDSLRLISAKRPDGTDIFHGIDVQSDSYLDYLVHVVKPFVDDNYSTLSDRAHCFIGGSSMGGLISLYAICQYPEIFGGAACLSTHWPGIFEVEKNPFPLAMQKYLRHHLPDPSTHRLYFDLGTATLDSMYLPFQKKVDEIVQQKGYDASNWMTKVYEGDDHSELSWSRRLNVPLEFLLSRKQ